MKLDGKYEGEFRVDVGSSSTVDLHGPFVKRNDLDAKRAGRASRSTGGGFGGTFTSRLTRMKTLEIGPYSWDAPDGLALGCRGAARSRARTTPATSATRSSSASRCTFDYEHRMLYLEPGKRYARARSVLARRACSSRATATRSGRCRCCPARRPPRPDIHEGDEVVAHRRQARADWTPTSRRSCSTAGARDAR